MNKAEKKRYLFFISQDYSFSILRPLQQAILQREDEVKWFLYGDEITMNFLHTDENRLFNIQDVIDYNPDAVFIPGNVVPSFIPGLKVATRHGLPSNKFTNSGQHYHFIIRGMFDLYCTHGPKCTQKFKELSKEYGYFHVEETGWPKLDPLFPLNKIEDSKQKAIFFASTFSPKYTKAKILYPLLFEMMKKYDFNWYLTLHPKMDSETVKLYKSINLPNIKFVESTEVIEYFKKSDVMLCDTSSIISEYLTQLKPVITFQTQKEEPFIINVQNIDELENKILSVLNNLDINKQNIENSVKEFHPYNDGKSSERILDAVEKMLNGENIPPKKKPLNLIRNFKLRKELNYWKF
ncbi:MAG: CDP-glycerol--glycerophosphate glycerophosphotransferase [Epsilonproteobacteria bacterium]|nr:MAG: CDP-glycerol--glycerophosphate glycerophosphotransferase [Campylobacterota bacterium]